jgi:hypothetical protein
VSFVRSRFLSGLADLNDSSGYVPVRRSIFGSVGSSSRGFVGAIALGAQGKRAVWIERTKGNTTRDVAVWAKGEDGQAGNENRNEDGEEQKMRGHVVYRHESFDLRGRWIIHS